MSAMLFVLAMLAGFPIAAVLGLALLGRARFTAFRLRRPREAPLTVRLADGRMLGYAVHGARAPGQARKVVFYLHGLMGSRLEFSGMRKEFADEDVAFVTIDRPGHGLSTPKPGRTYTDFANDLVALADHLEVKRFYVTGWSSGGCYALACASVIPATRLAGVLTIAADPPWADVPRHVMNPLHKFTFALYRYMRPAMPLLLASTIHIVVGLVTMPKLRERILESNRQSTRYVAQEMIIERSKWNFDIASISRPVHIWHGSTDSMVPVAAARYLEQKIPQARVRILQGHGHMIVSSHWADIVTFLVNDANHAA